MSSYDDDDDDDDDNDSDDDEGLGLVFKNFHLVLRLEQYL